LADSVDDFLVLERLTLEYSPEQDRLRLAAIAGGEVQEGVVSGTDVQVFWLTQRFCGVLLPRLLAWVGVSSEGGDLNDLAAQQARTQLAQLPSEPVRAPEHEFSGDDKTSDLGGANQGPQAFHLVNSLDIKEEVAHLSLILPLCEGGRAMVSFSLPHMCQWLATFYHGYCKSGWCMDVWPEWFLQAQRLEPAQLGASLH